jgi:integrase
MEALGLELLVVTGARVGEVSQLTRDDIKEVDGHWCIHIHEEGTDRTVKNKHSTRMVPLVDGAYGFDLTEFLKAVDNGALASEHVGKWELARKTLGYYLHTLMKDSLEENQTLHSLRHHLASVMQAEGVPLAYAQAVLGHATNSISFDTYGSGVPVKALAETLKEILKS